MITLTGLAARLDAARCALRGHVVHWRADAAECPGGGDIVCETCNTIHWCRWHDGPRWRDRLVARWAVRQLRRGGLDALRRKR